MIGEKMSFTTLYTFIKFGNSYGEYQNVIITLQKCARRIIVNCSQRLFLNFVSSKMNDMPEAVRPTFLCLQIIHASCNNTIKYKKSNKGFENISDWLVNIKLSIYLTN